MRSGEVTIYIFCPGNDIVDLVGMFADWQTEIPDECSKTEDEDVPKFHIVKLLRISPRRCPTVGSDLGA